MNLTSPILNKIQASKYGDMVIAFMYNDEESFIKEFKISKEQYQKIKLAYFNFANRDALKFLSLVENYAKHFA